MSQAAAAEPDAAEEMDASMRKRLPLQVRLVADAEGKLAELRINGRQSVRERPYQVLQDYVLQKIKSASDPAALRDEWEVELRADYALKYLQVVKAIDAVSGKKNDDGSVTPLLRKIKIVPDRRRPDTTPGTHVK